jgi:transposase-like protein
MTPGGSDRIDDLPLADLRRFVGTMLTDTASKATALPSGISCPASSIASTRASIKGLNNRTENSHQPTRRRERIRKGFKLPCHVQRFLSTQDQIANVFSRPHPANATDIRSARTQAFTHWAEVTGIVMAA